MDTVSVSKDERAVIGVIGIGRMGLPICRALVDAEFDVVANDLRAQRAEDARKAGARWERDAATLVSSADVLITVLPGARELRELSEIVSPRVRRGATWIDMTSATPGIAREIAARAHVRGAEYLDAPIGGSPMNVGQPKLRLFVGGPQAAFHRHRAMLDVLGTVHRVGESGAGYMTKLIINLLWFGQAIAAGEALLLGHKAGVDVEALREVVADSAAASRFVRDDLPALFDGDYLPSFGLDRCCEQLDAIVSLANQHEAPFELSTIVQHVYRAALSRYGPVDGELLPIAMLEEQAGVRLRKRTRGQQ